MGLVIAGFAGAVLVLPAISFVGTTLMPNQPVPATAHMPPLLAEAIWARTNGGRATELQPLNPFTIGRAGACHILAERFDPAERSAQHDECMKLLPGVQAVGYLSSVHMKSQGVWQDIRVPFVQIATMNRMTGKWSKAELLSTLAERAEFGTGVIGVEAASRRLLRSLHRSADAAAGGDDRRFHRRQSDRPLVQPRGGGRPPASHPRWRCATTRRSTRRPSRPLTKASSASPHRRRPTSPAPIRVSLGLPRRPPCPSS